MAQNDYMAVRFLKTPGTAYYPVSGVGLGAVSSTVVMLLSKKGNNALEANLTRRVVMAISPL